MVISFARFVICTNRCVIDKHMDKVRSQNRTTLDEDCLRWTPLVHTNLALIDEGDKMANGLETHGGRRNRPSVAESDLDFDIEHIDQVKVSKIANRENEIWRVLLDRDRDGTVLKHLIGWAVSRAHWLVYKI